MNKKKLLHIFVVVVLLLVALPALALATGHKHHPNHGHQGGGNQGSTVTAVNGTFRTPAGDASVCPDAPPDADCQIDVLYGDIGGKDNGHNPGAKDELNTVFIHEDEFFGNPAPGYWTYEDQEDITDTRGIFHGFENGVIDVRPAQSNTGGFWGHYVGTTADGCWKLEFNITGIIDLTGFVDQSANPVNSDSGVWGGTITKLCNH